jgi:hypothetical protein
MQAAVRKDAYMADQKITGRAKGGVKRAEVLSSEERKQIAVKAAAARWGEKPLEATHRGSFKEEFGTDVECYVLNDSQKTAVISQTGLARALGMSPRGSSLPDFLATKAMENVSGEVREKLANPLKFQWRGVGGEMPPVTDNGFDVTLLADICKAIVAAEADGKLTSRQAQIVRQAHIIQGASTKAGLKGLVYALAGYSPTASEVIAAFKLYVQEEAKKYEAEFPNELYMQWHRLYEIPVPLRGKPWQFKHLTVKHIYFPLAKSSGKILELLRALRAHDGDRQKKLFQFLNELGARVLRIQLGRVLEMAESSTDKYAYEKKIVERFGGQRELELIVPENPDPIADDSSASRQPS